MSLTKGVENLKCPHWSPAAEQAGRPHPGVKHALTPTLIVFVFRQRPCRLLVTLSTTSAMSGKHSMKIILPSTMGPSN